MCELAADEKRDGKLMVDPWEALQSEYTPTASVLDHFDHEINKVLGGAERPGGTRVPMRIMLLAGADLIETFSTPGMYKFCYAGRAVANIYARCLER
jgi:nicotinamide mononucleotide adenylyltransferase